MGLIMATGSDMQRVWFDHQIFVMQQYGGVSRYFYELSKALRNHDEIHARIFAPAHINAYLKKEDAGDVLGFHFPFVKKGLRYRPKLLAPMLRLALEIHRPQILHETYYSLNGLHAGKRLKIVTTVHDMVYEKFPGLLDRAPVRVAMKYQAMKRADHVICVSENTKKDLLEFYPEFIDKVSVVHHGAAYVAPLSSGMVDFPEPFILFVGTRTGYKNFGRLVKAIGASAFLKNNFGLVLFGGGKLTGDERAMIRASGMQEQRVLHLSGSDELLSLAYSRATAFVFPSVYEGFGMPLTEAMLHGCPIICSNASCFPEICGSAAEYFDPEEVDAIRSSLENALESPERLAYLARVSRARSGLFSWQKCAQETSRIYKRIL